MTEYRELSTLQTAALAAGVTVVIVLPVHITGAVAVEMQKDLVFGAAGLGVALGAFRAVSAIATVSLGRLTDSLGARRAIRIAAVVAGLASIGIATVVTEWWMLVAMLMIAGCANAMGHPAAHRLLMVGVKSSRRGFALGLKQAAPPISTILAGLSVPLIAVTIGWRWAFAVATTLAVIVIFAVPSPRPLTDRPKRDVPRIRELGNARSIVMVGVAFGMANAAAATVPAFYILSAVDAGGAAGVSGVILAVAGALSLVTRIVSGAICDRMGGNHLRWCSYLVVAGGLGLGLLASANPPMMAIGVLIAMAAGWGFNVFLWFPLLTSYPQAAGAITGVVARGGLLGGTLGPIIFGFIAEHSTYVTAWLVMAGLGLAAAMVIRYASNRFERSPPQVSST